MIPPYTYFGYIGSSILSVLLWPQVYTTFKTKNVEGLSGIFLILNIIATSFWILYGIGFIVADDVGNGIIIMVSNCSLLACCILLLVGKFRFSACNKTKAEE